MTSPTKADAVGGTKEKDVANKDTKALNDKLNIIKAIEGKVDVMKCLEKGEKPAAGTYGLFYDNDGKVVGSTFLCKVKDIKEQGNGNKEAEGGDGGAIEKVDIVEEVDAKK